MEFNINEVLYSIFRDARKELTWLKKSGLTCRLITKNVKHLSSEQGPEKYRRSCCRFGIFLINPWQNLIRP